MYVGMKLILDTKDCVRFGLMKGCVSTLEDIILAEEEEVPMTPLAGELLTLRYMPTALLLRAIGAVWTSPHFGDASFGRGHRSQRSFLIATQP